jgi:hypothetical protein
MLENHRPLQCASRGSNAIARIPFDTLTTVRKISGTSIIFHTDLSIESSLPSNANDYVLLTRVEGLVELSLRVSTE